jgi:predicted naringenin-chalcone synthase
VLDGHVEPLVDDLLRKHGLSRAAVDGWAVHPGGPRILDVIQTRLGLTDADLAPSRRVLAEHGNCSSPTVLMILEALRPAAPERIVALAFGPGLTLYAALFARRGSG